MTFGQGVIAISCLLFIAVTLLLLELLETGGPTLTTVHYHGATCVAARWGLTHALSCHWGKS